MDRLTEARVAQLAQGGQPVPGVSDGMGLTFVVTPACAKSGTGIWRLRYRGVSGVQRWTTLGKWPVLTLKAAQKKAIAELARIQDGYDPVVERHRQRSGLVQAGTFADVVRQYLDARKADFTPKTWRETKRYFETGIVRAFGKLQLKDIAPVDVTSYIKGVKAKSKSKSDSVARRQWQILSSMFSWAAGNGLIPVSPMASLRLTSVLGRGVVRERVMLTEDELRAMLDKLPMVGRRNELALKILMATCVRKSELRLAEVEHLDFDKGEWFIPAAHNKTRKAFTVPLAPQVAAWFKELIAGNRGSHLVLPAVHRRGPIAPNTLNEATYRLEEELGKDARHFTVHDLRSTARSYLTSRLNIDVAVAERCLNHSLGGMISIYDKSDYLAQRRRALEAWANFIEAAEQPAPSNVHALASRAA